MKRKGSIDVILVEDIEIPLQILSRRRVDIIIMMHYKMYAGQNIGSLSMWEGKNG